MLPRSFPCASPTAPAIRINTGGNDMCCRSRRMPPNRSRGIICKIVVESCQYLLSPLASHFEGDDPGTDLMLRSATLAHAGQPFIPMGGHPYTELVDLAAFACPGFWHLFVWHLFNPFVAQILQAAIASAKRHQPPPRIFATATMAACGRGSGQPSGSGGYGLPSELFPSVAIVRIDHYICRAAAIHLGAENLLYWIWEILNATTGRLPINRFGC